MNNNSKVRDEARKDVQELFELLKKRTDQSAELLDISDVLAQVYVKLDTVIQRHWLTDSLIIYAVLRLREEFISHMRKKA